MNPSCNKKQGIRKKLNIPVMLLLVITVMFYACGGSNDENGISDASNNGTLYITDDLNTDYHQVIVRIYKVEVEKSSDGKRLEVFKEDDGVTYDLRNLSGILVKLHEAFIPVGNYNRVIITVGNTLMLVDDNDEPITPNPEFSVNTFTTCSDKKCTIEIPGAVNVAVRQKVIVDFDLKQFKYDPDTNRVTAKVVVDAGGSKYRDYAEMKEDDYELKGILKNINADSFELILKRARHFMPDRNVVTVSVDTSTQYSCDEDDNVEVCQFSSFDDLEKGMKVEIDGSWNGLTFDAKKVELDADNDIKEEKTDAAEGDAAADKGNVSHTDFGWTDAEKQHIGYVNLSNISECTECHNIEDRNTPFLSCYECHGNLWDANDGSSGHHGWSNVKKSHQNWSKDNSIDECLACHNTSPSDKSNPMSCYHCHGSKW